jgi:hypothetical protein
MNRRSPFEFITAFVESTAGTYHEPDESMKDLPTAVSMKALEMFFQANPTP